MGTAEARTLQEQTVHLFERGECAAALPSAAETLSIIEKSTEQDPQAAALACENLALLHDYVGDYTRAEPLYVRAVEISEKIIGPDVGLTRSTLQNLFVLYANTGAYAKAESILKRAPQIGKELDATGQAEPFSLSGTQRGMEWRRARFLLASAWMNYLRGEHDPALALATQAVEIGKRLGATASIADALNLCGTVHYKLGDYDAGLKIYSEALQQSESASYQFGRARNWSSIGSTYYRQGNYQLALDYYEKSLVARRGLGNKDEIARALNDVANVHHQLGSYTRALELRQEALHLWEETANQLGVADVLSDIGWVYESMGEYPKALDYLTRALGIHQQVSDNWGVADATDHVALVNFKMGRYNEALAGFRDANKKFSQVGNREEEARTEGHIGQALHHLRRLTEAESAFQAALGLYEKMFGPDSPRIASTLNDLVLVEVDLGQGAQAIRLTKRSVAAAETLLANVLSFTSEQQRLEFQKTTDSYSLLATLGCSSDLARTLLRHKGIVLDSLLEDQLIAEASVDPTQRDSVSELRAKKQRLMQLLLEAPKDLSEAAEKRREAQKKEVSERVEELEARLARQVAGLGRARRALSVTVEQVQAALSKSDALIELLRYNHYLASNKWEPRYGAIVIVSDDEPKWVPLGNADEIEKIIKLYQKSVRGKTDEAMLSNVLRTLYAQTWAPIKEAFPAETKTVILSPDGQLSFVSFATLIGPDDKFLGEKYSLHYVASGRDLLRRPKASVNSDTTVYANPDFDSKLASLDSSRSAAVTPRSVEMRDLQSISLPPLPGTAVEAAALAKRAGKSAKIFLGSNATEAALRQVNSPHILHLATHGFFLPEIELGKDANPLKQEQEIPRGKLVNPMHRSGLALAGARRTLVAWSRGKVPPTENDGIVTAEEAGGLKLDGTWLVVLSACETGSGEARAGEGVMGLRRGFIQAGVQNLLMTLWPISDQITIQIMFDFYDAAQKTNNAPQALAEVQRDWLVKLRKERGVREAVRLAGPFIMSSQGRQ